jgi:DNA uptake protein ComE-like DNA-binding protein
MSNPFKQFVKEISNYSRSDRNALLILSGLIFLSIIAIIILRNIDPKPMYTAEEYEEMMEYWTDIVYGNRKSQSLFKFNPNTIPDSVLDSLDIPAAIKQNILSYRKAGGTFKTCADLQKIYGMNDSIYNVVKPYIVIEKRSKKSRTLPVKKRGGNNSGYFDPNFADSAKLDEFGFNKFQTKNILKYRKSGGYFKNPDDLLKIYGVDSTLLEQIKTHIKIKERTNPEIVENTHEVLRIELNAADSVGLVKLRGVGPVYAKRIIKYRNLLGGYYSKSQLLEVYNFPEETYREIEKYIFVDSTAIRKIRINFAEYNDLLRHPYLNKKQAKALLKYREQNGPFENIAAILLVTEVDSVLYFKISPYLTCR